MLVPGAVFSHQKSCATPSESESQLCQMLSVTSSVCECVTVQQVGNDDDDDDGDGFRTLCAASSVDRMFSSVVVVVRLDSTATKCSSI